MSRGLSKQQRSILGLAYSVRCALHGGKFIEYPEPSQPPNEKWRVNHLLTEADRLPDYQLSIGLHYLAGVQFNCGSLTRNTRYGPVTQDNPGVFAHTKESRCAKASLSRAANTLNRQGYFAWQKGKSWYSYGYVLTPKAYELGKAYMGEINVETAIALLIGLNINARHFEKDWRFKHFQILTDVSSGLLAANQMA